ncbi:hypothetical protein [Mesorhizobium sp.]|nr:hypothetical protein [Mesorhizobium sp.]
MSYQRFPARIIACAIANSVSTLAFSLCVMLSAAIRRRNARIN